MRRILIIALSVFSIPFGILLVWLRIPSGTCSLADSMTRAAFFLVMCAGLVLLIGISGIVIIPKFQAGIRFAYLPLAINVTTLLVLLLLRRDWVTSWQFQLRSDEYGQVVRLVEEQEIPYEMGSAAFVNVPLPKSYRHLARCGDEIMIDAREGTVRLFFIRDHHPDWHYLSGYLYRSDGKPAQPGDFSEPTWYCDAVAETGWYFCSIPD